MSDDFTICKNPATHRYEGVLNGVAAGFIEYRQFGSRIVIRHTEVDPALRGSGIGAQLVQAVLDSLTAEGQTLTNYCSFVAWFLHSHPSYRTLIDPTHTGLN